MSELDPTEWDGVYYDAEGGDFVTIDVTGDEDDSVVLNYYGSDAKHKMDREDFIESRDDFHQVPPHVVENPEDVLYEAAAERATELPFDGGIALQFAMEFTTAEPTVSPPDDTEDTPTTIPLTDDERRVLPEALESQAAYVEDDAPGEAHVLWSHAEALRGDSDLFQPVGDEWELPPNDIDVLYRALDRELDDLDAHSGPAYADSEANRRRISILSETLAKLDDARDDE